MRVWYLYQQRSGDGSGFWHHHFAFGSIMLTCIRKWLPIIPSRHGHKIVPFESPDKLVCNTSYLKRTCRKRKDKFEKFISSHNQIKQTQTDPSSACSPVWCECCRMFWAAVWFGTMGSLVCWSHPAGCAWQSHRPLWASLLWCCLLTLLPLFLGEHLIATNK